MTVIIDIVTIKNISSTPLQIGVGPVDEEFLFGTDLSAYDGSLFFDGSGLLKLLPNKTITIEEYRLNLGQIENYTSKNFARAWFLQRILEVDEEGNITDITDITNGI